MTSVSVSSPKIIFGLMSAVAKLSTVEQLIDCLHPHLVVVHHDFSQQSNFPVNASNARIVPDPRRTGYGTWAFVEGVIRLLEYCVKEVDFDYIQLLSPACLPIKPLSRFAHYVASSSGDGNAEFIDLQFDRDAMVCFAPRAYAPQNSWRRSLLGRARALYLGPHPDLDDIAGVQVARRPKHLRSDLTALAGYATVRMAQMGWLGRYVAEPGLAPRIGGAWIGAKRDVCEYLVKRLNEPHIHDHFRRFDDIGEIGANTILAGSNYRFGPTNTFVGKYNGWHPRTFDVSDLDDLSRATQFFARKFPDDCNAPVRLEVLEWVRG